MMRWASISVSPAWYPYIEAVILLGGFSFILLLMWLLARFMLNPAMHAAQKLQAPVQFQIVDFLYLAVQVQIAMALIGAFVSREQPIFFRSIIGFGFLATIGLWAGAVQFLSKAGVRMQLRRAVFILVYLPGALAILIGTPICMAFSLDFVYRFSTGFAYQVNYEDSVRMMLFFAAMYLLLVGVCIGLRLLGLWLVKHSMLPTAEEGLVKSESSEAGLTA